VKQQEHQKATFGITNFKIYSLNVTSSVYLEAERVQLIAIDKSKTERVRELEEKRQKVSRQSLLITQERNKKIGGLEAQLTTAKEALGEIAQAGGGRYLDIASEALTKLDGKDEEPCQVSAPKIVTLCGSTKFKVEFLEAQKRLTLEGWIVLSVGMFGHADNEDIASETKEMLDKLHLGKIDISSRVHFINKDGYIGDSTRRELDYSKQEGKSITYEFEELCPDCEVKDD